MSNGNDATAVENAVEKLLDGTGILLKSCVVDEIVLLHSGRIILTVKTSPHHEQAKNTPTSIALNVLERVDNLQIELANAVADREFYLKRYSEVQKISTEQVEAIRALEAENAALKAGG